MKFNFVAKHLRINKGGKMVDRKQQLKAGIRKHKKPHTESDV